MKHTLIALVAVTLVTACSESNGDASGQSAGSTSPAVSDPAGTPSQAPQQAVPPEPAAETDPPVMLAAGPTDTQAPAAGGGRTPLEAVNATPKGELVNPYAATDADLVAAGHQMYMDTGCNGCHGGTGGGGMCPALTNLKWVYGDDPDTLFRLITLGSADLQAAGYARIATERVKGYMPAQHMIIDREEDLWKIITWIQSLHLEQ